MGFIEILTIVFVCAKLFGAIAWSWWVFSPMWIGYGVLLVIGLLYIAIK